MLMQQLIGAWRSARRMFGPAGGSAGNEPSDPWAMDIDINDALAEVAAPLSTRWQRARRDRLPEERWTSFDRAPWRHPWLMPRNIQQFAAFSEEVLATLPEPGDPGRQPSYGFVGNLANINYCRAAGLLKKGLDITVHLHPDDSSLMSQPFWEDLDGTIDDLGADAGTTAFNAPLPARVLRLRHDPAWVKTFQAEAPSFVSPSDVLAWPEFMGFHDNLRAMQRHDALLISQSFYFGPLSRRPYVLAQSGGDMWFDPARDDSFGRLSKRALRGSYAVLVSNPITLAHARRYGLTNCLYVPFVLDETVYAPGDETEIRQEWMQRTGGSFFVLTSMRLDNVWKGAETAIQGFAQFARHQPGARLVVLGWGSDHQSAMDYLRNCGIADRVLLLPVSGKKRLRKYLRAADALVEQFTLGYYGGSGLEAMACGLPVIMRVERVQYEALLASPPPMLDANTADDVSAHLLRLSQSTEYRRETGRACRSWFLESHSASKWSRIYARLLAATASHHRIDWSASPLAARQEPDELAWQEAQLRGAPPFPEYTI